MEFFSGSNEGAGGWTVANFNVESLDIAQMEFICSFCLVCQLYLCVRLTPVCLCDTVYACMCLFVLNVIQKFVYDEMYCVCAGWWRTTRPTWQCWPYCKDLQIYTLYILKYTHIHKLLFFSLGLSETFVDYLLGSAQIRWDKHIVSIEPFWSCVCVFVLFYRGGLDGKATQTNLVLKV